MTSLGSVSTVVSGRIACPRPLHGFFAKVKGERTENLSVENLCCKEKELGEGNGKEMTGGSSRLPPVYSIRLSLLGCLQDVVSRFKPQQVAGRKVVEQRPRVVIAAAHEPRRANRQVKRQTHELPPPPLRE